jgi:N-acetylneuraminic acid mutarotase
MTYIRACHYVCDHSLVRGGHHLVGEIRFCVSIRRAFAITLALLVLVFDPTARAQQGHWIKLAPFPDPCPELIGAVAHGKMYLFGGLLGTSVKGLVYSYDPAANKWTKRKNMPLAAHHVMAVGYGDKIYLFGGGGQLAPGGPNWFPLNNSWEYDTTNDSWKALAPMPTSRGAGVAALVGGKVYVIGGASVHPGAELVGLTPTGPHRSLDTNEAYDIAKNTWETRSPMPTARNHMAVGVVNGKIYVLGGRVGSVFVLASGTDIVEEYDPATDGWGYAKARMPTPRSGLTFATYAGKIYVVGGEYLNDEIVGAFRDVEAYDPVADAWSIFPPLELPRNAPAGAVVGNRLYIVSGQMQSGSIGGEALASDATDAFEFASK